MNDEAREVLVAAALRGHAQAIGFMHHPLDNADCAIGVLHLALHETREAAMRCPRAPITGDVLCADRAIQRYELTSADQMEIIRRNDAGQDFLTIARKVGHDEDVA